MQTEIRVLGPMEVLVGGRPVALGGHRQQAVLAMLVAARGRVVPVERIVAQVWAGDPPPQPLASLQAYVSRLRRALEPDRAPRTPARVLVSDGNGYALRLPEDAVDAWGFVRDVDGAPEAVEDAEEAATLLRKALARWRGAPFARFAGEPWARAEITRLTGVHRLAREREVLAKLRLGHAGDAVPAAQGLAEAEPLRSRAWWLYALALWAAHRSAEALHALRRHRRLLTAELGLSPDPSIGELERAILEQRQSMLHEVLGTAPAERVLPAQLPRAPVGFAAREAKLAELSRHPDGLLVITGTGGVGKTALAVRWAHQVAPRYPDGRLYADLRGFGPEGVPAAPGEVLAGFLTALGVPDQRIPPGQAERTALLRSVLAGRRVLLVLDNAHDAEQVRPLLPGADGCAVVVTSRDRMSGLVVSDSARIVPLDVFDAADSRSYLRERLGAAVVDADPAARDVIVARCGGLPLALAVVCARAGGFPMAAVAEDLEHGSLPDLWSVFSWSYRQLPSEAAELFRRLALHPGPDVTLAAAVSVSGASRPATRAVLRRLTDAHLLDERLPGRFVFHDLLRTYAARAADEEDDAAARDDVIRRLVEHHLHSANNAAKRYMTYPIPDIAGEPAADVAPEEFADPAAALAWMAGAYDNVMALAAVAPDRYLGPLAGVLCPYQQDFRFFVDDSIELCRRAAAVAERDGLGWWKRYLLFLMARGHLWRNEGDAARPLLERVIASAREAGLPISIAQGLIALVTSITGYIGTPEREAVREAYPYALEALENYRAALDDPVYGPTAHIGTARTMLTIAWWRFYEDGDASGAAGLIGEAVDEHVAGGNSQHAAEALLNLGYLRRAAGDPGGAVAAFQRVLDEHGDVAEHRMDPLIGLYLVHTGAGDGAAAERVREQAQELASTARYHDVARLRAVLGSGSGS
ncbi:SARP family transcriptional regulator [Actinoplanes philippinensis]|uniref:DNA-binding transcriptional activator of the SARP family n=1 Tax=Actinoplanes philippinensis TaxID=35752 RepID=A0A1I2HNI0_9ACTN|nr:BTAD domain-containing putative transcriptional regulator [Actinoplanes philippinensis]GIE74174.1 SARP family transcriptional regulator [Actinoplanes philippinensis]SFF31349.1 DNA-binding transcriptional activator of the SARP family [Actinoplanes philippinensis]